MKSANHFSRRLALMVGIFILGVVEARCEKVKESPLEKVVSDWVAGLEKDQITQRKEEAITVTRHGKRVCLRLKCKQVFDGFGRGNGPQPGRVKRYKSVSDPDGYLINISISDLQQGHGACWDAIVYRKILKHSGLQPILKWNDNDNFGGFLSRIDRAGQSLSVSGQIGKQVSLPVRKRLRKIIQNLSDELPAAQIDATFFQKFEDPSEPFTVNRKKLPIRSGMRSVELNDKQITEISKRGSIDSSSLPLKYLFRQNRFLPKRLKVTKAFTQAERNLAEEQEGAIQCFWINRNRLDIFGFSEK